VKNPGWCCGVSSSKSSYSTREVSRKLLQLHRAVGQISTISSISAAQKDHREFLRQSTAYREIATDTVFHSTTSSPRDRCALVVPAVESSVRLWQSREQERSPLVHIGPDTVLCLSRWAHRLGVQRCVRRLLISPVQTEYTTTPLSAIVRTLFSPASESTQY